MHLSCGRQPRSVDFIALGFAEAWLECADVAGGGNGRRHAGYGATGLPSCLKAASALRQALLLQIASCIAVQ